MKLIYMSFADTDRPKGSQWLGAAYVEAEDLIAAIKKAWALKINPGGQVMSRELPLDAKVLPEYRHRLLTEDELRLVSGDGDTKLVRMDGTEY